MIVWGVQPWLIETLQRVIPLWKVLQQSRTFKELRKQSGNAEQNNCGIQVALKPFRTLRHIVAKPKDRVPSNRKTHAVYSIPCGDCEKVYLGQTKRQFCTRLKEHERDVSNSNSSKSTLAEHMCETSHNIVWDDSRIITTNNRYGLRLCLEAWYINASPCALNRDDGSYLPQEYLHLVGRWRHLDSI